MNKLVTWILNEQEKTITEKAMRDYAVTRDGTDEGEIAWKLYQQMVLSEPQDLEKMEAQRLCHIQNP